MSHPVDEIGIIDLMIGFPKKNAADHYQFLAGAVKDAESKSMAMPAQYMFTAVPSDVGADTDTVSMLIADMDRCGIARGMVHPTLSRTYPLEQTGQAAYDVHRNLHQGKVGVLCLAPEEGLGVQPAAQEFRATHLEAINRFRDV